MKIIYKRIKQIRELIWFHSPRFLHLIDYCVAEKRLQLNLYFPWQKSKGLRFYEKKIAYIDPQKVNYYDSDRFFSGFYFVQAGDWDLKKNKITDKLQYKIVHELFVEGKEIEQLSCFNDLVLKYRKFDENLTIEDAAKLVVNKYQKLQATAEIIKTEGYKTQKELNKSGINRFNTWYDEMRISIDRNGEYILSGSGNHRLMIAKLLGLDRVPVIIVRVHSDYYANFIDRQSLSLYSNSNL